MHPDDDPAVDLDPTVDDQPEDVDHPDDLTDDEAGAGAGLYETVDDLDDDSTGLEPDPAP